MDGADLRKVLKNTAPGLDVSTSTVTVRRKLSAKMELLRGIFEGGGERKYLLGLDTKQKNTLEKPGGIFEHSKYV